MKSINTNLTLILFLIFKFCGCGLLTHAKKVEVSCNAGKYVTISGKCQDCAPGTYNWLPSARSCIPCPANTYTPYSGVVDSSLCLPCPLDSYSVPGSASCIRCKKGFIQNPLPTSKSSSSSLSYYHYNNKRLYGRLPACVKCNYASCSCSNTQDGCPPFVKECRHKGFIIPPDGVSYFPKSVCVSAKTGCPRKLKLRFFVRRAICESSISGEVICPVGYIFDSVDRCLRCEPGARIVRYPNRDRKVGCEYCPGNSVSPGGLSTKCTPCPCGYAKTANLSSCFNTIPEGVDFYCS